MHTYVLIGIRMNRSDPPSRPYHHGDLHAALLAASEAILLRQGPAGLTLRAAAREAGVSHAAPAHHFGDLTGLLSELAALGFRRFNAAMISGAEAAPAEDPSAPLIAMGQAYLAFARANPALFMLMFRSDRLDMARPALREAADASFALLTRLQSQRQGTQIGEPYTLEQAGGLIASWSLAHGYTMLLLDRRLERMLSSLEANADQLFTAVQSAFLVNGSNG